MKLRLTTPLLLLTALLTPATKLVGAEILLTRYDYSINGVDVYQQMANTLTTSGHVVTIVNAKVGGAIASALGSKQYDQVFLWDLTSSRYIDNSDLTALSNFWSGHKGLVVDTRSYGYYFQGSNASEQALLQNVAYNFTLTGGGVWVGTDHDSAWTQNANPFLSTIGVNPVSGVYSDAVNFADPSSVLLSGVTPTDLWAAGQSVGRAPVGLQPNGINMYMHFGHDFGRGDILPYISASFPLEGPKQGVPDATSTFALFSAAVIGLVAFRRRS